MTRIAVLGAGLIGREHAGLIVAHPATELAAICDPSPAAEALAARLSVPHFADYVAGLEAVRPDGAIVALPNQLHEAAALACIERGIASLVEKPVADTVAAGARIAEASERTGVPVLVGHHRRHSPDIRAAKAVIEGESSGRWWRSTA